MDQAWETDVGEVAGGAEDAFKVPDRFGTGAVMVSGCGWEGEGEKAYAWG